MPNINRKRLTDDGYVILRDIIPIELIEDIIDFSNDNIDQYETDEDDHLFKTEYKCFNAGFCNKIQTHNGINNPYAKMHSFLLDLMQEMFGLRLIPTFHFGRVHLKDTKGMKWHVDRLACEVSVTMPFAYSGPPWPVWLKAKNGKQKVDLKVGDILVYKGCEIPHHREPYNNDYAFQHYFHYIDVESEIGSFAQYFDTSNQSYWPGNIDRLILDNNLPNIREKEKEFFKENING